MTDSLLRQQLTFAAELRHQQLDMIEGRVVEPSVPSWCERRGWTDFLLGIEDERLALVERLGFPQTFERLSGAPEDLLRLGAQVRAALSAVPRAAMSSSTSVETFHVAERKRPQVGALVELCRSALPRPRRVLDVGAGLGHVTRALGDALQVPAVGVELLLARATRAQELSGERASFVVADASAGLPIEEGDLVVGLHACGSLGDALLTQARARGAHVALVSCCLQKVPGGVRPPLSGHGRALDVECSHVALGLSNISNWDDGGKMARIIESRAVRHGLRRALQARGLDVPAGAETHGIHRRKFPRGLAAVLDLALRRRGLQPATLSELHHFEALGRQEYGVIRRLSVPRNGLGRLLELMVVLDRGVFLDEAGYQTKLVALVASNVTPRNLTLVARAPEG